MNELISAGGLLVSAIAACVVLIGPGAWLLRSAGLRQHVDGVGMVIVSLVGSVIFATGFGGALIAFGFFRPLIYLPVVLVVGLGGCFDLGVRLWRRRGLRPLWSIGGLLLVSPWALSALQGDLSPANVFEWNYADLGRVLSSIGGVPQWVAEFGERVRWQPDYVSFNILSEFYLGLNGISDAQALANWRLPLAALGLLAVFAVARLWLSRFGATVSTLAVASTLWYLSKFNAYKPESLGIVIGLSAIWLIVTGLRKKSTLLVLGAGTALGLGLGVHAIAAATMAMFTIAAALVEWWRLEDRKSAFGSLILAVILSFGIAAGVGWVLQGRLLVAADATNPGVVGTADPTWEFLQLSAGLEVGPVPTLSSQLATAVTSPWQSVGLVDGTGLWIYGLLLVGVVFAVWFGPAGTRRFLWVLALFAGLLVAAMLYFGLGFETYVPRHTGLGRIGQYLPLLVAMSVGVAAEGFAATAVFGLDPPRKRFWALGAVVLTFGCIWTVGSVNRSYTGLIGLPDEGRQALALVGSMGESGDIVVTNAATHGTVEFFTGLENPLDARQPLIEDVSFLEAANQAIRRYQDFFADPGATFRTMEPDLRPQWVIAVASPELLGAVVEIEPADLSVFREMPRARVFADSGDVVVVRMPRDAPSNREFVGPLQTTRTRAVTAGLVIVVVMAIAWLFLTWRRRKARDRTTTNDMHLDEPV